LPFKVEEFVEKQVQKIREILGKEKALIAVSGGVDSTTCAALTHKAIGENLVCVIIDTGFMRKDEPEWVVNLLSKPPLNLPIRLVRAQDRFIKGLEGLEDAEEKRKKFREIFYTILSEIAKEENCKFMVQGTIAPDWIETRGGIKSQHNILLQIGIDPVKKYGFQIIEPLAYLYKDQVRMVARYLKVPPELSERQPFPGPGLVVRVVGRITEEKLNLLKEVTKLTEEELVKYNPQQYFAAILDDEYEVYDSSRLQEMAHTVSENLKIPADNIEVKVFKNRATGVKGDVRSYGKIMGIATFIDNEIYLLPTKDIINLHLKLVGKYHDFTRILYLIAPPKKGKYAISLRAVTTRDFMTASATLIPKEDLRKIGEKIMNSDERISRVYYDITQKPPATVEYE